MKKIVAILCLCMLVPLCAVAQSTKKVEKTQGIKISSTIGPVEAGIIPLLAEKFTAKAGIPVSYEKAGTGATLEKAKSGNFDLVVVHAKKLEDAFIRDGYGVDRRDIMYNDFVILGPASDPAGIQGMTKAIDAFARLAEKQAPFVTRGDKSGTHVKEMEIWQAAGISPTGPWYTTFADGAKGNKATTLFANAQNAYVLMDRATWLTLKNDLNVKVLMQGDPLMMNYIAIIRVNPEKFPTVNARDAEALADWLEGPEAQNTIKNFEVATYGEPLFFPNAKPKKP